MKIETTLSTLADKHVLKNLFVYFRYDRMQYIEHGPGSMLNEHGVIDGESSRNHEQSVADMDIFYEKPNILFPFLVRADGKPIGFALVAKRPHCSEACDQRLQDFMIITKYRRKGIGRTVTKTLFELMPGRWQVEYIEADIAAGAFWRQVVGEFTHGRFEEVRYMDFPGFRFST